MRVSHLVGWFLHAQSKPHSAAFFLETMQPIPVYVGYDPREAVAYHTFCQSVLDHASRPVAFIPLALDTLQGYTEDHTDGSNEFIYSRFLVPWLQGFQGWAIFADGDMICRGDIAELWDRRNHYAAVMVAKHDYRTKHSRKYLGQKNEDYPRKNWSSVILWNCAHFKNRTLTPEVVKNSPGSFLHRFSWLQDDQISALPLDWNWLVSEYPPNEKAKLVHQTLGTPCFKDYATQDTADEWYQTLGRVLNVEGQHPQFLIDRLNEVAR